MFVPMVIKDVVELTPIAFLESKNVLLACEVSEFDMQ